MDTSSIWLVEKHILHCHAAEADAVAKFCIYLFAGSTQSRNMGQKQWSKMCESWAISKKNRLGIPESQNQRTMAKSEK